MPAILKTTQIQEPSSATVNIGLDSAGNVGIGTTTPTAPLDVKVGTGNFTVGLQGAGNALLTASSTMQLDAAGASSAMVFKTVSTERMRIDTSGNLLVGTTTQSTGALVTVNGSIKGTITSGTSQASTSGTSIDFTSIPSWAKRVTLMLSSVSTNGNSFTLFQLGTSSGVTTSGYVTTSSFLTTATVTTNSTAGFVLRDGANLTDSRTGSIVFTNITGNTWVGSGVFTSSTSGTSTIAGNIALASALDRVRVTTVNGTDVYDAGTINILYEG